MNTLHLSSVFPSFLYLGPWGCPQVLSPSMWVRMALFGARRTERKDLAMRKFRQGEFEYMVFFHVFFFQIWIQWIQWVPLYFQVFVGEIRGFFQHFPKFSGEIPGCSPIFRGTNRPGPASTARQGCCAVHLAAENDGERAAGERSLAVLLGSCANQAPWPRLPRLGSD